MISIGQAALLGVIQGLTEFIPVSSTAHLRIVPALLGWGDPGAAYSAVIQLGTLAALLVYFRRDLLDFGGAALRGLASGHPLTERPAQMAWFMVLGTIPVSVFGLAFARLITGEARSLYVISWSLIGLAVTLYVVDLTSSRRRELETSRWSDWLLIGLAQSLALIPGASRSGTTLTMGLLIGFSRQASMRISFLLSIPAIALSGFYELFKERAHLSELGFAGLLVGTMAAGIVGYGTIAGLLRFLRTHTVLAFCVYRILLGVALLSLLRAGILLA